MDKYIKVEDVLKIIKQEIDEAEQDYNEGKMSERSLIAIKGTLGILTDKIISN